MTKTLEMVFKNATDRETVLRLADPKDDLTLAGVMAVMQDIVAKNVFQTEKGDLVEAVTARINSREITALN